MGRDSGGWLDDANLKTEFMTKQLRQSAFSLMEVMLAVAILAMGLVFVASMFPVGLANTAKVGHKTMGALAAQTVDAELRMRLPLLQNELVGNDDVGRLIYRDQLVHYLSQPNTRVVYTTDPATWPDIIIDDPTGFAWPTPQFSGGGLTLYPPAWIPDQIYPYQNPDTTMPNHNRKWPFYFSYNDVYYIFNARNLGLIVSPPVTEQDQEVREWIQEQIALGRVFASPEEALNEAIYRVSLDERKYSTAVFYQLIRGGSQYTYKFFIFTFRKIREDARYAVQSLAGYNYSLTTGPINISGFFNDPTIPYSTMQLLGGDQDRKFPIPWLVNLNITNTVCSGYSNYLMYPGRFWFYPRIARPVPDYFEVCPQIAALLRKGSYIIDADTGEDPDRSNQMTPPPIPTTTDHGFLYKVLEVEPVTDNSGLTRFYVKLETPLRDDLNYFWVFPPPLDPARHGDSQALRNNILLNDPMSLFDLHQPVVDVKVKILSF